ncbi:Nickel transport system permease protein NikB [Vibrio aerogenes CECT 7868]|uniref:Nickel transport system permease protein NikB n=1 Tax=Vibrio aerogenes CECT 7868 TaxID=1216006 RepID=A0A1M5ZHN6_9VIBR|nr:nickel ABC transporter permease subunit NikB [Vibrio aerogenes]SHI23797.1 Nickel transport system permease protein NikB [Vibrio aerogenes CECT 7868]
MLNFVLKRFGMLIPMLFAASVVIFLLLRLGPGDPAIDYLRLSNLPPTPELVTEIRHQLGLDQPLIIQYGRWIQDAIHLDFGRSYATGRPVLEELSDYLPATLQLAGVAMVLIVIPSLFLGLIAARYRNRLPDHLIRLIALLGVSVPNFWLAFLFVMLFSVKLGWLPSMGYGNWRHLILPAISIALMSFSINARMLRASILEVSGQRHVYWARLRGLSESVIQRNHILRNALLPVITLLGMHFGELLGGTLVIESIFSWPGVGRYAVSAVFNRDYPVIQCVTLMMVFVFVVFNLLTDVGYAWLDPRIRLMAAEENG